MFNKLFKKAAYTLVELLLVVGIISVAGTAAYIVYSKVERSEKISSTVELASLLLERVGEAGSVSLNYNNYATPLASANSTGDPSWTTNAKNTVPPSQLITSGVVPSRYTKPDGFIYTGFGTKVGFVAAPSSIPGDGVMWPSSNVFILTLTDLDVDSCIRVSRALENAADMIIIHSVPMSAPAVPQMKLDQRLDQAAAEAFCSGGTTANVHLFKVKRGVTG